MATRVALLVNLKAGKGNAAKVCQEVIRLLEQYNIQFTSFSDQWPGDLAIFSSVFLIGGDGTLNYFINKYPSLRIPFAIFKGGSGNDFAWKLYGNITVEDYFKKVISESPQSIDCGICNSKLFINGVGIGFDGAVVKTMLKKTKFFTGHVTYLLGVVKTILRYNEKLSCVESDALTMHEKVFMITVANGSRYGGGFIVAPEAKLNDGKLDLVVIKKISKLKRFFYLPLVEKGKHTTLPFVITRSLDEINISSEANIPAHIDGEFLEVNRFSIRILKNAFKVYM